MGFNLAFKKLNTHHLPSDLEFLFKRDVKPFLVKGHNLWAACAKIKICGKPNNINCYVICTIYMYRA
jgi:hypothetical protein